MASKKMTPASGGLTSRSPQRVSAAPANSTKTPRGPVMPSMPGISHPQLAEHTRPAVVTGPTSIENGRLPVRTRPGAALRGTKAAGVNPC